MIREYYNDELAKAMESLLPEYSEEEIEDLEYEIGEKINEIESLEAEVHSLECDIRRLEENLAGAEKEIEELETKLKNQKQS